MVKPRETAELIDNRRKCLEKESAKKETTFLLRETRVDLIRNAEAFRVQMFSWWLSY